MSDDIFRLAPHDIRRQEFGRAMRGFERGEVEAFLQRVAEQMDHLLRDRQQQEERLLVAQDQLKAFRERERALSEALVAAQQLRDATRDQAQRDAEGVLREAHAEAERILERARQEERLVRERTEALSRQLGSAAAGAKALLQRQLAELAGLQAYARGAAPPVEQG